MSLLAQVIDRSTIVLPTLDGITAILAAFFFYCLAKPAIVKNRTQFWGVFAILLGLVAIYTMRSVLYNSTAAQVFFAIMTGLLQVGGMVLTVLYVGGMTGRELADELKEAAADFRTAGESKKPVIVPLTGDKPRPRDDEDAPRPRIEIELPKRDE